MRFIFTTITTLLFVCLFVVVCSGPAPDDHLPGGQGKFYICTWAGTCTCGLVHVGWYM